MQDWVSTMWVRAVGSALAAAMVWVIFVPYAFPWLWATWAVLIVGTIVSLQRRSSRSLREMIDDSEGGRVPAVVPVPAGPAPRRLP